MRKPKYIRSSGPKWAKAAYLFFSLTLVIGVMLASKPVMEQKAGERAYNALRSRVQDASGQESKPLPESSPTDGEAQASDVVPIPDSSARTERSGGPAPTEAPPLERSPRITMDADEMKRISDAAVAWLRCEGTELDYPVVQGADNEYYLTHLYNGVPNSSGALFVDCRSSSDFSDRNTVIYGHHIRNGTMFASIVEYKYQEFYDLRPVLTLMTPYGDYNVELFAGTVEDGDAQFARFDFQSDEDFLNYVNDLKNRSTFRSDVALSPDDRIVTLCTCSYDFINARYAVYGKLTPILQ